MDVSSRSFVTLALSAAVCAAALSACSASRGFDPMLKDQERYACCNLRFNQDNDATDANYLYPTGTTIPIGTKVNVVEVGNHYVRLSPLGDSTRYYLELRFGLQRMSPQQYFDSVLLQRDPSVEIASSSPEIQQAIREARFVTGMTKREAIMARGYPPAHRTPSTDDDVWLYYTTRGFCEQVRFVDGRVATAEKVAAPQ